MEMIPYIVKPRPDTGLTNGKMAMWLFLASEVMLFASLFSAYVLLRTGAPTWPDQSSILNVPLATVNTMFLITSSITMIMAWTSLLLKDVKKYKIFMALTILLGTIFMCVKGYEYSLKFHHHLYPSSSTFLAIYFVMTGLHGLHLLVGIGINIYQLFFGVKMWETQPDRFTGRIELTALYWHFVDLMWIFLFPVLYLL